MISILHITTHMGGGVGRTISDMCVYYKDSVEYKHKILCLEQPENMQFINKCTDNGIEILTSRDSIFISKLINEADIVQLSWWAHPLMLEFLYNFPNVKTRMVLWSHISGCTYPKLRYEFISKFNMVFLTSKFSFENYELKKYKNRENICVIYGSSDLSDFLNFNYVKDKNKEFIVGYIGTLSFSKIYSNFIELCSKVRIPNCKFIIVGEGEDREKLIEQVKNKNLDSKFEFKGYSLDVREELSNFDVFGYPLNNYHFGTTENCILEAMSVGVPVVAFNQCAEKYIISDNITGLLANSEEEYISNIEYLYHNREKSKIIARNARQYICDEFSTKKKMSALESSYRKLMNDEKKIYKFDDILGNNPVEWFISCLGKEKNIFERAYFLYKKGEICELEMLIPKIKDSPEILKGKSKSSVVHFLKYYNDDFFCYLKKILS